MDYAQSLIERSLGKKVSAVISVGGGSISTTLKASLEAGGDVFVKISPQAKDMFPKEANGLAELSNARAIRVPKVLFVDEEVLILEYCSPSSPLNKRKFFEEFGRQFARLHQRTSDAFGYKEDNYIGSTPQKNVPCNSSWRNFFLSHRLEFQYRLAEKNGYADSALKTLFNQLENCLDDLIPDDGEKPSLLHGDLWGGNYLCVEGSVPAVVDPAVYYGHREADLAMTMLFGGFDESFYSAYRETRPLHPGWERRMELYKLYHLFNHLNLFGEGYYGQVLSTMKKLSR